MQMAIDDIVGNFELLDDWEDRYRYLIELGRTLEPLAKEAYTEANKVRAAPARCGSTPRSGRTTKGRSY